MASRKIWGSYRSDVHHMNPNVKNIDFETLAKDNIQRLSIIEHEIFETTPADEGNMIPVQPKYWDIGPDGMTTAYLRLG